MVSCMSKQILIAELLFGNVGVQQSPYEPVDMSLNTGFGSKFQQFPIEFLKTISVEDVGDKFRHLGRQHLPSNVYQM